MDAKSKPPEMMEPAVLITGVTDGIGRALAEHYASAGNRVLGVGRRPQQASPAALLATGAYCQVDLARPGAAETMQSFLDARGIDQINLLVHNAAVGWYGPIAAQSQDSIAETISCAPGPKLISTSISAIPCCTLWRRPSSS